MRRKRNKTVTGGVKGTNMYTFIFTFMILIPLDLYHLGINKIQRCNFWILFYIRGYNYWGYSAGH